MSQKIADSLEKTKKLVVKINSLRKMIFYTELKGEPSKITQR